MTENGDLVKYTVKELLLEIRESVSALDKRMDTLEKDMQEGKETVKSMLLPDYHGFKTSMQLFEREATTRLDKLDRGAEMDARFHENNVPVFKELVKRVDTLEKDKISKQAVDRYRNALLVLILPGIGGGIWAIFKVILWMTGNNTEVP